MVHNLDVERRTSQSLQWIKSFLTNSVQTPQNIVAFPAAQPPMEYYSPVRQDNSAHNMSHDMNTPIYGQVVHHGTTYYTADPSAQGVNYHSSQGFTSYGQDSQSIYAIPPTNNDQVDHNVCVPANDMVDHNAWAPGNDDDDDGGDYPSPSAATRVPKGFVTFPGYEHCPPNDSHGLHPNCETCDRTREENGWTEDSKLPASENNEPPTAQPQGNTVRHDHDPVNANDSNTNHGESNDFTIYNDASYRGLSFSFECNNSDTYDPISALARTHPTETPYKAPPPPDDPNAPAIDGRGQTG